MLMSYCSRHITRILFLHKINIGCVQICIGTPKLEEMDLFFWIGYKGFTKETRHYKPSENRP